MRGKSHSHLLIWISAIICCVLAVGITIRCNAQRNSLPEGFKPFAIPSAPESRATPYLNPTPGEFPLMGIGSCNGVTYYSEQLLKDYHECGLNIAENILKFNKEDVINHRGEIFSSLKNAQKTRMKLMIRVLNERFIFSPKPDLLSLDNDWIQKISAEAPLINPQNKRWAKPNGLYDAWETVIRNIFSDTCDYRPAIAGWMIDDEPTLSMFWYTAECKARMQRALAECGAPDDLIFINLYKDDFTKKNAGDNLSGNMNSLPDGFLKGYRKLKDYNDFINRYIRIVNPSLLSFDAYPTDERFSGLRNNTIDFYNSLETISSKRLTMGLPFWSTVLTCGIMNGKKVVSLPTIGDIRFQAYAAIGAGAQGLSFWRIGQTPRKTSYGTLLYPDSPIALDGSRTPAFAMVKEVCHEIKKYQHIFLNADLKDLRYTKLPPHTRLATKKKVGINPAMIRNKNIGLIKKIEKQGAGLLVGTFIYESTPYTVIVNMDIYSSQQCDMQFKCPVQDVTDNLRTYPSAEPTVSLTLRPGDWRIFRSQPTPPRQTNSPR